MNHWFSARPAYARNDLTDKIHEKFGFMTDYQIIPYTDMKKLLKP